MQSQLGNRVVQDEPSHQPSTTPEEIQDVLFVVDNRNDGQDLCCTLGGPATNFGYLSPTTCLTDDAEHSPKAAISITGPDTAFDP